MRIKQLGVWMALLGILLTGWARPGGCETAKGTVFLDENQNGVFDANEKGIPDVLLTNGRSFTKSGEKGAYQIEIREYELVSMVKPAGYELPLNAMGLPGFYYTHKPEGSPTFAPKPLDKSLIGKVNDNFHTDKRRDDHFIGVLPTGPLPAAINFPLLPGDASKKFDVIVTSDPQPDDLDEINYIRDQPFAEMITEPAVRNAAFGIALGDIVSDHLDLYEPLIANQAHLKKTWFHVIGNHDQNKDSPTNEFTHETWHRVFGPNYYALFQGDALFVALDDICWSHKSAEDTAADKPSREKGSDESRFDEAQIKWLSELLSHHPKEKLLVILMHIPLEIGSIGEVVNRQALYDLLEGRKVLALCGHTHFQAHDFIGKASGFKSEPPIHQLTNVTLCGGWWNGIRDERGIPLGFCLDGVDNGYTVLSIDGSNYITTYKAYGRPWSEQIRVYAPRSKFNAENKVIANVFAGSERSKVEFSIDGGEWAPMKLTPMKDPLTIHLREHRDESLPNNSVTPTDKNFHMWASDMLGEFSKGTHTALVRETDQYGQVHESAAYFAVE